MQNLINLDFDIFLRNISSMLASCVFNVKGGFGFIKCAQRDAEVYFHFSELEQEADAKKFVDVEFSVVTDSWTKKPLAISIKVLPEGSVKFEEILEGRYKGTIEKELRGRGQHSEAYRGKLSMTQQEGENSVTLDFGTDDIDNKYTLRRGDKVEFNIAVDNRTKSRRATHIVPSRETGTVTSIRKEFGVISTDSNKDIFFDLTEVPKDQTLKPGDRVEFILIYHPKTKETLAQNIIVLPEEQGQRPTIHKMEKDTVTVLRQPLTPDSTPKFGGGRGRLLPQDREKLIRGANSPKMEEKKGNLESSDK